MFSSCCNSFKQLIWQYLMAIQGFPGSSEVKESACNAGDPGSVPGLERFSWRRKWQPTPVFLPGKFHGQRSLAGYRPWGHKRVGHDLATKQKQQQQDQHSSPSLLCVLRAAPDVQGPEPGG